MIALRDPRFVTTLVAALGCGLMAGVFFAFSSFVMKALGRLSADQGIAAMQSVNVWAVHSWFLGAFLGTAAVCALVIILAVGQWSNRSAFLCLAGAVMYLLGCFMVTMLCNVPLNNELAALAPDDPARVTRWARYLADWTVWNHVRAASSFVATALLILGLD